MGLTVKIPAQVRGVLMKLVRRGFEAYAVGGCVRDSILGTKPLDWDMCTSARPEETQSCFDHCILTGVKYGTVTAVIGSSHYEITTFRAEEGYEDRRHPDQVRYLDSLYGDLARRDFSINAMAADADGNVIDHFDGLHDLRHRLIRCVGEPKERFTEDALRILRALRFASRLDFTLEPRTAQAVHELKDSLLQVSAERIRKELSGILLGKAAPRILEEFSDVIAVILPELQPCIGFVQHNPHHIYDVYRHSLECVSRVPAQEALRLAAFFHDIGKPHCFHRDESGRGHFYGHAEKGATLCHSLLRRLRYDNKTADYISLLVREHDVYLQPTTEKGMRRLLSRLGQQAIRDLIRLRRADALATGTADPQALEASLAETEALLERLLAQEGRFTLADLEVDGNDLIALGIPRGRQIGGVLRRLFDAVLEGNCQNERTSLMEYVQKITTETESH